MLFLVYVVYFLKKTSNESQLNMMTSLLVLCADDSSWATVWSNNSWDNRSSRFSHTELLSWSGEAVLYDSVSRPLASVLCMSRILNEYAIHQKGCL